MQTGTTHLSEISRIFNKKNNNNQKKIICSSAITVHEYNRADGTRFKNGMSFEK